MTMTFATNSNNDIYLDAGNNLAIATGLAAVMEACRTASLAQLGEEVLFTENGIPTFQTIWVGTPNYALFTAYLQKTLLQVDGVQEIVMLDLKTIGDVLSYRATIKTVFGTGELVV